MSVSSFSLSFAGSPAAEGPAFISYAQIMPAYVHRRKSLLLARNSAAKRYVLVYLKTSMCVATPGVYGSLRHISDSRLHRRSHPVSVAQDAALIPSMLRGTTAVLLAPMLPNAGVCIAVLAAPLAARRS